MTKKTHLAIGTLVSLPVIASTGIFSLVGILGSIAPDIDKKLKLNLHRKFTHSLIALVFTSFVIKMVSTQIALIWFISFSSHLILDSMTKTGIPWFYPLKKRYGLRLFTTGKIFDKLIGIFGIGMIIIYIASLIII